MEHEEVYEPQHMIGLTGKARERYIKVHSQESPLRKAISSKKMRTNYRHREAYRKSYYNYFIRLPKAWADGLELEPHDRFVWNIISYDPVVLQLRKLEGDTAA